jgi:hypothetical protein
VVLAERREWCSRGRLTGLTTAAEIAFEMAMKEKVGECTIFCIEQFKRLADELKKKYYRGYR